MNTNQRTDGEKWLKCCRAAGRPHRHGHAPKAGARQAAAQAGAHKAQPKQEPLLVLIPAIVYFIIFCYLPMYGVQIAFKYYSPRLGIWGSTWTGMENLNRFFDSYYFWRLLRNTVGLSLYNLIVAFPFPILLALVFNEVKSPKLKKPCRPFLTRRIYFCGGSCRHPEPVLQPGQRPDQRVPRQNGF
ncbi:MAG: hypothetical protein ACLRRT_13100 [Ruthenibacterium lactatiformans]